MKTKEVKYKEAIARNELHRKYYELLADKKDLSGDKRTEFINHKIGVRKS